MHPLLACLLLALSTSGIAGTGGAIEAFDQGPEVDAELGADAQYQMNETTTESTKMQSTTTESTKTKSSKMQSTTTKSSTMQSNTTNSSKTESTTMQSKTTNSSKTESTTMQSNTTNSSKTESTTMQSTNTARAGTGYKVGAFFVRFGPSILVVGFLAWILLTRD